MSIDFAEPRPDVALLVKNRLLEIMGSNLFAQFSKVMRQSGAVVTGSFVLQCILGERWRDSDIDFFVPEGRLRAPTGTQTSELDNWLFAEGVYKERGCSTAIAQGHTYTDVITGGDFTITMLRDYWLNDVKFQLVHINRPSTSDVCSWIESEFDFPIVKNSVWVDAQGQWQWSVADWNSIETKSFAFQINRHLKSSLRRRAKYEERGFEIRYADPRALVEKWSHGYYAPFVNFCNFKSKRPLYADTNNLHEVEMLRYDRYDDFADVSLFACVDEDCVLHQLSCWHMHGLPDRHANQVVFLDKDAFDIVRAGEIVMALHGLRLSALEICLILKFVHKLNTLFCKPARLWNIVKTIKNFKRNIGDD
jgi:hypothetical protein